MSTLIRGGAVQHGSTSRVAKGLRCRKNCNGAVEEEKFCSARLGMVSIDPFLQVGLGVAIKKGKMPRRLKKVGSVKFDSGQSPASVGRARSAENLNSNLGEAGQCWKFSGV